MAKDKQIRIRSIDVNNFKSLVQFEIKLAKFTCLIGLNGVGKSTVLQFIDFLSQLVRGDLTRWLDERQWKPRDVSSKLLKKNTARVPDDGKRIATLRKSDAPGSGLISSIT